MAGDNQRLVFAVALLAALLGVLQATHQLPELRAASPDPGCTKEQKYQFCLDCRTVKNCVNVNDVWYARYNEPCDTFPNTWCQDGECTSERPASCDSAPSEAFTCTSDGYFPNLVSCSKYWLCVRGKAYPFDCSEHGNAVYDQRSTQCVPKKQGSCFSKSCSNKHYDYYVYEPAPWLSVVCTDGTLENALVVACANENQRYYGIECSNACNRPGRFPVCQNNSTIVAPGDEGYYYECVASGKDSYTYNQDRCPLDAVFDAATQRCKTVVNP